MVARRAVLTYLGLTSLDVGRIIFLDIDGVMNSTDKYDFLTTFPAPGMFSPFIVDLNKIKAFEHVLLQTPFIKVVVSSTWRLGSKAHGVEINSAKDFAKITRLNARLFHTDWRTPLLGDGRHRGDEVEAWLDNHPEVFKYAVIDDCYPDQFKDHVNCKYIQTDPHIGMTFNNLDKMLRFFGVKVRRDFSVTTAGGPLPMMKL